MADDAAEQAYAAAVEEIARVKAAGETNLDLSGEAFHALTSIPPELAGLTNLETLYLANTQVSDLAPLARLTDLTTLNLDNTQVSDLTLLAGLTKLMRLDLDHTPISELSPLAGLKNLETLYLDRTQVSDLTPLAGLTNLETLYLDNTQVSDLAPLARLTNLMRLDLDHTQVSDLAPLASLTNLETLDVDNTQVSDLAPLASLTNLETLRLDNTQVSDLAPLAGLTNLETLYLDNTQVSGLAPLARLTNLEWLGLNNTEVSNLTLLVGLTDLTTLRLANTYVSDLAPLAGLTKLMRLDLDNTQASDLAPLARLTNLETLYLDNTQVSDLEPLAGLKQLAFLGLHGSKVRDLTPLAGLKNLASLKLDGTLVADLRPLVGLDRLAEQRGYKFPRNVGLRFRNTPATARDGHLAQLAKIKDYKERTRKTLEYLRSLPPWPKPYTPEYTPDGSPPQPIGGAPEGEEVLVPAPVRAPLEVEVVDGRLRPARPGDGLGEDAHERARQAWQALRDFLADLVDIRPRIVNQMPQLERALTRLEDALGDDYEAANPIAMGIHGERVIKQAGAAGETMADADAAELREFAAALSLFLERFPAWLAYRDEGAPTPPKPPRIEDALPEIEAITEKLREHDAIAPAIPESLEKQAGDVRSNPEDSLAKRGLVDSLKNVLGRIGEAILAGGKWVLGEIVDVGGQYYRTVKSLAVKGAAGATVTEITLLNVDIFANLAPRLHALATSLPEKFGWLKNFLAFLGLA
jgi:Leucine-rich repeat (LRR) protein